MTQEVLFRGRKTADCEWLYGQVVIDNDGAYHIYMVNQDIFGDISSGLRYVDKNTVGQYIGIKDRNNIRIFDGDIIKDIYTDKIYTVFYVAGGFAIESNPESFGYGSQNETNPTEPLSDMQMRRYIEDNCNVIGNIYDNNELLYNN